MVLPKQHFIPYITLSSLLSSLQSLERDAEGLLFGTLDHHQVMEQHTDDEHESSRHLTSQLRITITHFHIFNPNFDLFSSKSSSLQPQDNQLQNIPTTFYYPRTCILNTDILQQYITFYQMQYNVQFIGWFRHRPFTTLRETLRERSICEQLARYLHKPNDAADSITSPLLFGIFSVEQSNSDLAQQFYRFFTLDCMPDVNAAVSKQAVPVAVPSPLPVFIRPVNITVASLIEVNHKEYDPNMDVAMNLGLPVNNNSKNAKITSPFASMMQNQLQGLEKASVEQLNQTQNMFAKTIAELQAEAEQVMHSRSLIQARQRRLQELRQAIASAAAVAAAAATK